MKATVQFDIETLDSADDICWRWQRLLRCGGFNVVGPVRVSIAAEDEHDGEDV
jgi:hypothetical protein